MSKDLTYGTCPSCDGEEHNRGNDCYDCRDTNEIQSMNIFCTGCNHDVEARLTDGSEIYPHRNDLSDLPFWKCDTCNNFVGCHHKTTNRTKPLGCIPTKEIKAARQHIHKILDPLWKSKTFRRRDLYSKIAERLGIKEYHTAEIRSVDEARQAYKAIQDIARGAL